MRKMTFLLMLILLLIGTSTSRADNTFFDSQTAGTPLPGKVSDGQIHWTSAAITTPTDFKTLRLTFLENTTKNHMAGYPFVVLSEFYLYDKTGQKISLSVDQFSSNATQSGEGRLGALCDNSYAKQSGTNWYWHSTWQSNVGAYHYLEIKTTDLTQDLSQIKVGYVSRNENGVPAEILVTTGSSTQNVQEQVTTFLTKKAALPVNGKTYYFYNKRENNDDRYYYDNNGNVGFATVNDRGNEAYMWVCEITSEGKYVFKNAKTQKYFAWHSLSTEKYNWTLSATIGKKGQNGVVNAGCVTLKGYSTGDKKDKFLVSHSDKFDKADRAGYFDAIYSSDFCFVECNDLPGMPIPGLSYYFVNKHMGGDQYFYDNNGKPGFGKTKVEKQHYVWICEKAGEGKYAFKNLKTGMYFAWKSLSKSAHAWTLSTTEQVKNKGCVTMRDLKQGSPFMVCKQNAFDQAKDGFYNETYSSDFYFVTCSTDWNSVQAEDLISTNYGEKWIRLAWKNNNNHTAGLGTSEPGQYENCVTRSVEADLTSEQQLWALVGNESEGFYLQNKAAGETLALHVANTNNGTAATLVTKVNATKWKLVQKGSGIFAITPASNTSMSLNSYGGALKDLKLYDANDPGSLWTPQRVVKGLNMRTEVRGNMPEKLPIAVGELKFTIDGISTTSRVNGSKATATYYLPDSVEVELIESDVFRGFSKGNFTVNGTPKESITFTTGSKEGLGDVVCIFHVDPSTGQYLYTTPDSKGKPYRIPAIATAPNGDIFAISDNRPCGSDIGYGEVDIKCRISKDNGQTWGEEFFIADGMGDNNEGAVWKTGFGDAAVVADAERNEILVMMVCGKTICHNGNYIPNSSASNPNRVARVRAKLDEATGKWNWTYPEEVTEDVYKIFVENGKATVQSLFIGSGRICQSRVTKVGDYYRLYCAVWTKNEGNRVIYSDDFGETWKVLGKLSDRPGNGGDEPKCEEMPDGSVILSSRRNGRLFNIYRYTNVKSGEGQWLGAINSENQTNGIKVGNSTNGEIMLLKAIRKSDNTQVDLALQSVPFGNSRREVGIFFKEIKKEAYHNVQKLASEWTKGLQVTTKESAYSTMTLQQDNRIGFFFEEAPGGYCMVYIPLSIEKITNNQYALDDAAYPSFCVQTHDAGEKLGCALSTFSAPCATTPALKTVKAFYVSSQKGEIIQLMEITPQSEQQLVIPANTGVILQSTIPTKVVLRPSKNENVNQVIAGNLLFHTANGEKSIPVNENAYILSGDEAGAAFFKLSASANERTIAANRAYLVLPQNLHANSLEISFGEATGIEHLTESTTQETGILFDLCGRRVMQPNKNGIYIRNGKKFIIK